MLSTFWVYFALFKSFIFRNNCLEGGRGRFYFFAPVHTIKDFCLDVPTLQKFAQWNYSEMTVI